MGYDVSGSRVWRALGTDVTRYIAGMVEEDLDTGATTGYRSRYGFAGSSARMLLGGCVVRMSIRLPEVHVHSQWRDPENILFRVEFGGRVSDSQLGELVQLVAMDWWRLCVLGWLGDATIHGVFEHSRSVGDGTASVSWSVDGPGAPLERLEVQIEVLRRMIGWWSATEGHDGAVELHLGVEWDSGSDFESVEAEEQALVEGMAGARLSESWLLPAFRSRLATVRGR